ncbi:NAD-dependent epimerase/dehydratase family protein [Patescibacteria group bacterium]
MSERHFHQAKNISERPVVLVAGGAGFLGSFLCELLLMKDCQVLAVDNLSQGRKENLAKCFDHPNFTFINQDLTLPFEKFSRVEYIFHLAGIEVFRQGKENPLDLLKVNAFGTLNLLKLASQQGAKFLLGSSSRIDQVDVSLKELDKYFGQSEISSRLGSLFEAKRFAETLTTQFYRENHLNARIVRFDYLYGPRMSLEVSSVLASLIKDATKRRSIKIPGDGTREIYPTFVSDAVYGLSKAMFSAGTSGKIFSLLNIKKVNLFNFARELNRQNSKNLSFKYVSESTIFPGHKERKLSQYFIKQVKKSSSYLNWQTEVNYQEGLDKTLKYFSHQSVRHSSKGKSKKSKKWVQKITQFFTHKSPRFSPRFLSFVLLVTIIFYLPVSFGGHLLLGSKNLLKVQKSYLEGNFSRGLNKSLLAQKHFQQAGAHLDWVSFILSGLGQPELLNEIEKLIGIGKRLGVSGYQIGKISVSANVLGQIFFLGESGNSQELLNDIKTRIEYTYSQLSLAEAELKSTRSEVAQGISLSEVRQVLLQASRLLEISPKLFGLEGRQTYLVLLQNNMELRPTGGFIGSFALVTIENGKLINFEIQDVYNADGQLKGHVEPPQAIKKHLGEASWYLRDSNWHPGFPNSALSAEWFLGKELGQSVDGVIAVNLYLAQNILQQIGGVNLVDYQETINDENLFEKASYYSESDFFPGSKQKKDFLSALAQSMFDKVKSSRPEVWLDIVQAVHSSFKEKDLMIYLKDPSEMKIITDLGFDGRLKNIACRFSSENCYLDYLMIVEANVGVNKANHFVERKLSHQVRFDSEGKVEKMLQINYLNHSLSEVFPAGRYKNYLRIIVPEGTTINQVKIDGQKIKNSEIERKRVNDKISFGFLVQVPVKGETLVEVDYQLEEKIDLSEPARYLLLVQKQSGIRDKAFHFWLMSPPGSSISNTKTNSESLTNGAKSQEMSLRTFLTSPEFNQDLVFEAIID